METNFTDSTLHNAHKFAYLAKEYKDKNFHELVALFVIPAIEMNAAIWCAQDLGLVGVDKETNQVAILKAPSKWDFGPIVEHLQTMIPYIFGKLALDEADMEDNYFGNWAQGFAPQDVTVAMLSLIDDGVMAHYKIKDGLNDSTGKKTIETYTFYTLAANKDKQWGKKQFKVQNKLK